MDVAQARDTRQQERDATDGLEEQQLDPAVRHARAGCRGAWTISDYLLGGEGRGGRLARYLTAFVAGLSGRRSSSGRRRNRAGRDPRWSDRSGARAGASDVGLRRLFYSDNDGNPIRDWGDLFRRLRAGAQAPARSTLEKGGREGGEGSAMEAGPEID